jgi:S-adenosylhomocysteine hydrolase
MVPVWNGHGKTVIEYLSSVAELVQLSPQMIVDLGTMALLKFTDHAQKLWQTQTVEFRNSVSQSWILLYKAIQVHFLNEIWVQKRTTEWEEMRFHQKGHENEWTLDFVQR